MFLLRTELSARRWLGKRVPVVRLLAAFRERDAGLSMLRGMSMGAGLGRALLAVVVSLSWAGLVPLPLSAQDAPSKEKAAQYRELIGKALQEYSLGHWPEARVFFADAHALWPNARTLRGLGMACYEARSYVEAIGYLEQALENKTQPLTPKLAAEARSILEQAERFVSTAYLATDPAPSETEITIDDKLVQLRPNGAVLLDPGEHTLQVTSPGYRAVRRPVHAEAGRDLHVRIDLQPLEPAAALGPLRAPAEVELSAPPPPPEPQATVEPERRLTLAGQNAAVAGALSAVGLAGIATGWVFYALRDKLRVELWRYGLPGPDGQVQAFDQSKFRAFQLRGGIALGAAGLGVVAMTFAEYFWLPDQEPVPAWAWVAGGVGTALALGALGWAAFGKHCDVTDAEPFCASTASDPLFAPMLAMHALPFVGLPLFYLIRERVALQDSLVALVPALGTANRNGNGNALGLRLSVSGRF